MDFRALKWIVSGPKQIVSGLKLIVGEAGINKGKQFVCFCLHAFTGIQTAVYEQLPVKDSGESVKAEKLSCDGTEVKQKER